MNQKIASYLSKAVIDILDQGYSLRFLHKFADSGEILDWKKMFTVSIRGSVDEWFPSFIHEYCHLQQTKEGAFSTKLWIETDKIYTDWTLNKIELSNKDAAFIGRRQRLVELDCEKRAVREIKKYKLPVNINTYIKQANAYIYSYTFLVENRVDLHNLSPAGDPRCYNLMPTHFLSRYDRIPKKYREVVIGSDG